MPRGGSAAAVAVRGMEVGDNEERAGRERRGQQPSVGSEEQRQQRPRQARATREEACARSDDLGGGSEEPRSGLQGR